MRSVCALRLFYTETLNVDWDVTMIPFGKRPRKLPQVLSPDEVRRLPECVQPFKTRFLLTTIYAQGLRNTEARHLKNSGIDSQRMMLRVEQGKGAKDRYVPLSTRLLQVLRDGTIEVTPATSIRVCGNYVQLSWTAPLCGDEMDVRPLSARCFAPAELVSVER